MMEQQEYSVKPGTVFFLNHKCDPHVPEGILMIVIQRYSGDVWRFRRLTGGAEYTTRIGETVLFRFDDKDEVTIIGEVPSKEVNGTHTFNSSYLLPHIQPVKPAKGNRLTRFIKRNW